MGGSDRIVRDIWGGTIVMKIFFQNIPNCRKNYLVYVRLVEIV